MIEKNIWKKNWNKNMLSIALVYPNSYTAMAGLTVQTLYSLWNSHPNVVCERFFLPENPSKLPKGNQMNPLQSMENGIPLKNFDIIAFTVSYELDYPHLLWFLDNARIPFFRDDRFESNALDIRLELDDLFDRNECESSLKNCEDYPLIIIGGATIRSNPLPIISFVDAAFIGEIEEVNPQFLNSWFEAFQSPQNTTNKMIQLEFLKKLKDIEGFWVPGFTEKSISKSCVERVFPKVLDEIPHPVAQIQPIIEKKSSHNHMEGKNFNRYSSSDNNYSIDVAFPTNIAFQDTFFLEVTRGCPHLCRFCMTGSQIKPYRYRSLENMQNILNRGREQTNFSKIALIGSSVTDHPHFEALASYIISQGWEYSVPSIRVDKLTSSIATLLKRGGMKTITIAPETGSDSLRKRLNKHITNEQIIRGAQMLYDAGIPMLKVYLIIGFPDENNQDIEELITLVNSLCKIGFGKNSIKLSINPFIPKAHTPFEMAIDNYYDPHLASLKTKMRILENAFKTKSQIKMDFLPLWEAFLQAVFALGDENFSVFILDCYNISLSPKKWYQLATKGKYGWNTVIHQYFEKISKHPFGNRPWNVIDQKISQKSLKRQWELFEKQ